MSDCTKQKEEQLWKNTHNARHHKKKKKSRTDTEQTSIILQKNAGDNFGGWFFLVFAFLATVSKYATIYNREKDSEKNALAALMLHHTASNKRGNVLQQKKKKKERHNSAE